MATIKQGILGAFSGKVANVVGSSWKGIPVMKSLPPSVANPKTALQTAQRDKMKNCTKFATETLANVLKPLNDRFASRMSGYNLFVSRNISLFDGDGILTPTDLTISPSGRTAQLIDAIAAEANITTKACSIVLDWSSIAGSGSALESDKPYVAVYNRTSKKATGFTTIDTRGGDQLQHVLPLDFYAVGTVIDVYLAFLRADGTVVFETAYITHTVTEAA